MPVEGRKVKREKVIYGPMDTYFLVIVLILVVLGLIMMFSASYANAFYLKNNSLFEVKSSNSKKPTALFLETDLSPNFIEESNIPKLTISKSKNFIRYLKIRFCKKQVIICYTKQPIKPIIIIQQYEKSVTAQKLNFTKRSKIYENNLAWSGGSDV